MTNPRDRSAATEISVVPESVERDVHERRRVSAVAEEARRKHDIGPLDGDSEGDSAEDTGSDSRFLTHRQSIGGGDEIEQLRRDVSRLEGKVDALLTALKVDDADP
jgi:putative hemolysin